MDSILFGTETKNKTMVGLDRQKTLKSSEEREVCHGKRNHHVDVRLVAPVVVILRYPSDDLFKSEQL